MTRSRIESAHFLLVDDLEENLLALEALLRREGLVLLKARSGPEALELLLKHEVALALIDVRMPGMDGFELAELMRGTERTRRVPIIFLTAGTEDRQRRFRGYEAGAVDFLHKPLEPDVLRSKAGIFLELWRERQEVARQRDELQAATAEIARLLEDARRTAAALKDADRQKEDFLALLAHELRNPLAPIRNGLEVLKLSGTDANAITQARLMMERQLAHMVRLIDDLLDVSRISRNKMELRRARVLLADIVSSAVETARPPIEAAGHELTIALPAEPIHLDADLTRLAQVFANLLSNSAKYTEPGGHIWLTARRLNDQIAVSVRDTGIGIPAEALPTIFDMFSQVDRSLERSSGGLGIGLALVKGLVEMHGGTVEVASPGQGKGSTFTVRLPIPTTWAQALADACRDETTPAPGLRRRILAVDDNRDAAHSMALMLELMGNEVRTAHNGLEAVEVAEAFRPQVILMDIGMPRLNGLDATSRIRQQSWGKDIWIIAISGWGQEQDREQSRAAGCNSHLIKPVDVADLQRVLAEAATK